jgi:hypothetical protein
MFILNIPQDRAGVGDGMCRATPVSTKATLLGLAVSWGNKCDGRCEEVTRKETNKCFFWNSCTMAS